MLKLYDDILIKPNGQCDLKAEHDGSTHMLRFQVMETSHNSFAHSSCLSETQPTPNNQQPSDKQCWFRTSPQHGHTTYNKRTHINYDNLFNGLGCLPGELHLEVDPSIWPAQQLPKQIPIPIKANVAKAIQDMEQKGIIKKLTDPTPWISNMVVIQKNYKLFICIVPSPLNKALLRSHYQMPTIKEILHEIANAKASLS